MSLKLQETHIDYVLSFSVQSGGMGWMLRLIVARPGLCRKCSLGSWSSMWRLIFQNVFRSEYPCQYSAKECFRFVWPVSVEIKALTIKQLCIGALDEYDALVCAYYFIFDISVAG